MQEGDDDLTFSCNNKIFTSIWVTSRLAWIKLLWSTDQAQIIFPFRWNGESILPWRTGLSWGCPIDNVLFKAAQDAWTEIVIGTCTRRSSFVTSIWRIFQTVQILFHLVIRQMLLLAIGTSFEVQFVHHFLVTSLDWILRWSGSGRTIFKVFSFQKSA